MSVSQNNDNPKSHFSVSDTNALKGLAIILMFYHHLFAFPNRIAKGIEYRAMFEIFDVSSAYAIAAIGKICVAIFVFLGGYGTYVSCVKSDKLSHVIHKRYKSMYISLWKVFLVFIPICMLFNVKRVTKTFGDIVLNFVGLKTNYNREWWFFAPYLVLVLLIPAIKYLVDRSKNIYVGLALSGAAILFSEYLFPYLVEVTGLIEFEKSIVYTLISNTVKIFPGFLSGCIFARYDVLTRIKTRFSGRTVYSVCAVAVVAVTVCIRGLIGEDYDYILVMLFVPAVTVSLNNKLGGYVHRLLNVIGRESTNMWLIHSFYCYYLCQSIVYAPYYTPLIALWLLVMTFASSKILNLFWKGIGIGFNKVLALAKIK